MVNFAWLRCQRTSLSLTFRFGNASYWRPLTASQDMNTTTDLPDDTPPTQSKAATVALTVLVASAFVMILNETILSVALRVLADDLGVAATTAQWLTSGFLLTMAIVIPTTGFLLERFTPRQVFSAAMTLFTIGTLLGAVAPGFSVLLGARVLQASGTAVMIPLLMTSIMRLIPAHRRGATMGTITIVIAVAPAIGPTVGGAVLSAFDWRWMFWLVLPLAIAALALGTHFLRLETETRSIAVDVVSIILSAAGFGGVLYGLSTVGETNASSHTASFAAIGLGVVALTAFVLRQTRLQKHDRALLDLRPFTRRQFSVSVLVMALLFMCFLGAAAILLPLYLQTVLQTSTFVSGLVLLPGGLVLGLMGRPVGKLYDRIGARKLVIPGAVAMTTGLALFTTLGAESSLAAVVAIHMVLMAGLALMMTPLMTESLSELPAHLYSHGSAILATLQQVAGAFGTAVFVSVATRASLNSGSIPDAEGLQLSFVVAACIGAVAFLATLLLRGKAPVSQAQAPAVETSH